MQKLFRRATFGVLVVGSIVAIGQQSHAQPVTPNYGRFRSATNLLPNYGSRMAWNQAAPDLPDPMSTAPQVGSGVKNGDPRLELGEPVRIPLQGSVLTNGSLQDHLISTSSQDACSTCGVNGCDGDCGSAICDTGSCHGGWFGGLYYMYLFRDDDTRGQVLAYDDLASDTPLLSTGTARMQDANGFGLRFGKMLSPCCAIEAIYWQVFPGDSTARMYSSMTPGNLNSSLAFTGLEYDDGLGALPVDAYYQGTQLLEVERTYDYRNFELNFLKLPFVYGGGCGKARLALLGGVRYFRGDESFRFATDFYNASFGDDPATELCYCTDVENHLVGFQLGALLDYPVTCKLSGNLSTKFGIYNNHMKIDQALSGGAGGSIIDSGAFTGQPFAVVSKKDDVAFLGELDAGLSYAVNCHWRLTGGYRVMAISGYAQAISQIPYDFTNLSSAAHIQDKDSLILHGAYAGVEFAW